MTKEGTERAFMQMPLGYAYHEIIFGIDNHTQEYILTEANDTFFRYLGLDKEKALHKNVLLLPDDDAKDPSWHTFYENLSHLENDKLHIVNIGDRGVYRRHQKLAGNDHPGNGKRQGILYDWITS